MKIRNIILSVAAALSLTACDNYLDVEAPSSYDSEFVFSMKSEVTRALNGVYAQALVGNLYGDAYFSKFQLNSDVDITTYTSDQHSHTAYQRFDCDEQGGDILKFWTAAYNLIEYANKFISSAEASDLIYSRSQSGDYIIGEDGEKERDPEMMQWIGEAKCLRAMVYHDLVVMFGDVPFTFTPTTERGVETIPVYDRQDIQDMLIADLKEAAPYMSSTSGVTVERCSKEFAQGLIARIALTAGGYSLRPDKSSSISYGTMKRPDNYKEYYEIVREYAGEVINSGTHNLRQSFQEVFVNECNYQVVNDDDPIFELPFAKMSTGNIGYIQGPAYNSYEGTTTGPWGKCGGGTGLNALYRYLFRDGDRRREFVNGLWSYTYVIDKVSGQQRDSLVIVKDNYKLFNNKWSKLWTAEGSALGNTSEGSTGINYPYLRYADVLLMYAEAANELNDGPTEEAVECLEQVHNRAFPQGDPDFISEATASKDAFQKAVLNERKWEFAGENSRWRDLVRTNTYAEEIVYSFLRYYSVSAQNSIGMTGYEDAINEHDGLTYIDQLPGNVYYHRYYITEGTQAQQIIAHRLFRNQLYGYVIEKEAPYNVLSTYPNQSLQSARIFNPYKAAQKPVTSQITAGGFSADGWSTTSFYTGWGDSSNGRLKNECKNSFYGYILADGNNNIWIMRDGAQTQFPSTVPAAEDLPAVRYILPYPRTVIQRSGGVYKNYYGY
jgi:hypothetical protein